MEKLIQILDLTKIMQFLNSTLERNFIVKHGGKTYYVNYLNSDGQILGLINRYHWEIFDEEHEELNIYVFGNTSNKELKQIEKNIELANKLISFCIKHFNDYQPVYEEDL